MTSCTNSESLPGPLTARYRIRDVLCRGFGGVVYRCDDLVLGRPVVLKLLQAGTTAEDTRLRFLREGRLMAAVEHPRIVRVFDVGETGETLYVVMELLEGQTLQARVRMDPPLGHEEVVDIACGMLDALSELLRHGILHRDVKPHNTILARGRGPVLIDFGLAKLLDDSLALTVEGALVGTPLYMAPEVITRGAASFQSDMYSVGVVLYQMIERRLPFQPGDLRDLLLAHANTPPPPLVHAPRALAEVVLRCLAKLPDDRFAAYDDLAITLRASLPAAHPGSPDAAPASAPPPVAEPDPPAGVRTEALGVARIGDSSAGAHRASWRASNGPAVVTAIVLGVLALGVWRLGLGTPPVRPHADAPGSKTGRANDKGVRAAASISPSATLLPVLDMRVRPLERSVYVHCRTTEEVRLEALATPSGASTPGIELRQTGDAGFVHRFVISGLDRARRYRVEVSSHDRARTVRHDPLWIEAPRSVRGLGKLASSGIPGDPCGTSYLPLADVRGFEKPVSNEMMDMEDSDLACLIKTLESAERRTFARHVLATLRILAHPRAVPAVVRTLERETQALEGAGVVSDAIGVLAATGGPAAAEVLARFAESGLALARTPLLEERLRLRIRAAISLARIDPVRAGVLFDRLRVNPGLREVALHGASVLPLPWYPAELALVLSPVALAEGGHLTEPAVRAALRAGGSPVGRLLGALPSLGAPYWDDWGARYLTTAGLATWGDASALPALSAELEVAPASPPERGSFEASVVWQRQARTLQALGMIGSRESRIEVRRQVLAVLSRALADRCMNTRRAALFAMARMTAVEQLPELERALDDTRGPRQELAVALARAGSRRGGPAIEALLSSGSPTDLWAAAVATSVSPDDERPAWIRKLREAVDQSKARGARAEVARCMESVLASPPGERETWVDPSAPWVPTGVHLRRGSRFRVSARGLTGRRQPRTRLASPWEAPGMDEDIEIPGWVAGPGGLPSASDDTWTQALVARIGQQLISPPLEPRRILLAQDEGELLLRISLDRVPETADLAFGTFQQSVDPFTYSGFLLARVEVVD